jgi:hypothetical protein
MSQGGWVSGLETIYQEAILGKWKDRMIRTQLSASITHYHIHHESRVQMEVNLGVLRKIGKMGKRQEYLNVLPSLWGVLIQLPICRCAYDLDKCTQPGQIYGDYFWTWPQQGGQEEGIWSQWPHLACYQLLHPWSHSSKFCSNLQRLWNNNECKSHRAFEHHVDIL